MSLRKSLRQYGAHLNRKQRRAWMVQRLTLTLRVRISSAHVPKNVARVFTYVNVGDSR